MNDKPGRKENDNYKYDLRWLDQFLGDKYLADIDRDLIAKIRVAKEQTGVKARTVNAVLQQIRVVLNCAKEHELLNSVPTIKLLPEPRRRIRFLSEEQEKRLLAELPPHLQQAVILAINTGVRKANNAGLRWDQIDMVKRMAYIDSDEVKTDQSLGVPLNDMAMKVLRDCAGKHPVYVLTYRGKPFKEPAGKAWRKALKRAGIKNFTFHDLRHVFATRHVEQGTSLYELQELGCWKKADTVKKYAHLSTARLLHIADRSSGVTNLAHVYEK